MTKVVEHRGRLEGFHAQMPIALLMDHDISSSAKVLFGYLVWRQGNNAGSWPSVARIAEDFHVDEETARRWAHELEEHGWITIQARPGQSNIYTAHATPLKNETPSETEPPQTSRAEQDIKDSILTPLKIKTSIPIKVKVNSPRVLGESATKRALAPPDPPDSVSDLTREIRQACSLSAKLMTKADWTRVARSAKLLSGAGADVESVAGFRAWWNANDWRGQKGEPPRPENVRELWVEYQTATVKKRQREDADEAARQSIREAIAKVNVNVKARGG